MPYALNQQPALLYLKEKVSDFVIPFIHQVLVLTFIYYLGFLEYSLVWIYSFTIILVIFNNWNDDIKQRWAMDRIAALGHEKGLIVGGMKHLPSWVNFPDIDRAEWLNKTIRIMWPIINGYARDLIPELLEPSIQNSLSSFKFTQVSIGSVPLRIDGIKVYDHDQVNLSGRKVILDLDLAYAGNCKINFKVSGMGGGIVNFRMKGKLRIMLKPLIPRAPIVGGIQIFFMKEPEIDFNLIGITALFTTPGLKNILLYGIIRVLKGMLLFPNFMVVNLVDEAKIITETNTLEPDGVLRVQIIEGKNLISGDITGLSDPYLIVRIGNKKFETPIRYNTLNPVWNFWCEFEVDIDLELELELWDYDTFKAHDPLGSARVNLDNLQGQSETEMWVQLQGVAHGSIHLNIIWIMLTSDYSDLDAALKEATALGPQIHTAYFVLYLHSASNLPLVQKHSPDPYVTLTIEQTDFSSGVVYSEINPRWATGFKWMVVNPKTAILQVKIFDSKTKAKLGKFVYKLDDLKNDQVLTHKMHQFPLMKTGIDSFVTLSMKLLIFKNNALKINKSSNLKKNTQTKDLTNDNTKTKKVTISPAPSHWDLLAGAASGLQEGVKLLYVRSSPKFFASTDRNEGSLLIKEKDAEPFVLPSVIHLTNKHYRGKINLTITYRSELEKLIVTVHAAEIPMIRNPRESYVKIQVLCDSAIKDMIRKTKVVKPSYDPIFDETFEFFLPIAEVGTAQLVVVLSINVKCFEFRTNPILGRAIIDFGNLEIFDQATNAWYDFENI